MRETKRNFLVGVFMITGLGAAGVLMLMFGELPSWLGGAEYEIGINIKRVSGIQEGTPLNMNGVEVGRVGKLVFEDPTRPDRGVTIMAKIKNDYIVPRGTTAKIYVSPIGLGSSRIELQVPQTDAQALPVDGSGRINGEMGNMLEDVIPPTMLATLEDTARQVGTFAEELTPAARDLHHILESRGVSDVDATELTGNLTTAIERLDSALKNFNDVFGQNEVKDGIRESIENTRDITRDGKATFATLRQTAEELQQDVDRIADKMEKTVENADNRITQISEAAMPVLDNSAKLTANLNKASLMLTEGNGTAALLLRDPRLYEAMLITFTRLTDMIDSARRIIEKWERQGYVEFTYHSVVGPVPQKHELQGGPVQPVQKNPPGNQ